MSTDRAWALPAALALACALASCTVAPRGGGPTAAATTSAAAPAATSTPAPAAAAPDLQEEFARLRAALPATVGVAVAPVGATGADGVEVFGDWSTGVAWSTMKVPLALAALRAGDPAAPAYAAAAITQSDNDAAEALWQLLGAGDTAATAVEAVLREAGDTTTEVPPQRVRPEFTAFGQSQWDLRQQTVFAAHLPCLPGSAEVTGLMGRLTPAHQWGLAAQPGGQAKGGWGPGYDGRYLVRQFGVLPAPGGGAVAVALAATPNSGAFADGVTVIGQLSTWVGQHLAQFPAGACG